LLQIGANPRLSEEDGIQTIHYAVKNEDYMLIKFLLDKGIDINTISDRGTTPMFFAQFYDSLSYEMAEYLIDNGADLNIVGETKVSSLQHSCGSESNEMVMLLIDSGAKINNIDHRNITPIMFCVKKCNEPGKSNLVEILIKNGAKLDVVDQAKRNILHHALEKCVDRESVSIVKMLLNSDVNVNQKDILGNTPLHYVAISDAEASIKFDLIKMIIEHGGNARIQNHEGKTFANLLIDNNNKALVDKLELWGHHTN
jgi:ankyrin repeat protein